MKPDAEFELLGEPLELPCGLVLKNRMVKAAMSDALGDGHGDPTDEQVGLYERWAAGGVALSLIGEVSVDPRYPEKPGNLVLGPLADRKRLTQLAAAGSTNGSFVWPQLGHAGALAHPPISRPAGPSALDVDGLTCDALTDEAIGELPAAYAAAARIACDTGFSGVEVHSGHGFLLSQFLSPLFNRRTDGYGGSIEARSRLLVDIIRRIRRDVGAEMAIGVKLNSTDQLVGGLTEDEALVVIERLGNEGVDLLEISGGTYFPGAEAASDRASTGPYFVGFCHRARAVTDTPLMVTGGIKTRREAIDVLASGAADAVGLARALVLDPDLPDTWLRPDGGDPQFPRFRSTPPGGVTAWYTMRMTAIANGYESSFDPDLEDAIAEYESRDNERIEPWLSRFG